MTAERGRIAVRDCPDVLARPIEIHAEPCARCPSAHYPPDPEALDMREWPRHLQVAAAFPCGWRPTKLCKGYCDSIGMAEADLGGERDTMTTPECKHELACRKCGVGVSELGEAAAEKKDQLQLTKEGVEAIVEACAFDLGVLVSVVRLPDGTARVECAVHGSGPANLGPTIGQQLREVGTLLEQRMVESSERVLRGMS